jgi:hypothetical protein
MRKNHFSAKHIILSIGFLLGSVQSQSSAQMPDSVQASFNARFSLYAHALKGAIQLSTAQVLQDGFSVFVNREHDCFEYDAAKALAYELDTRLMSLADVTLSIDKTIEKILPHIIQLNTSSGQATDVDGVKIQYMILFLSSIFQNDTECGRCILETYIKILGLDTDDDDEVMKKKHERVAS